jgi:hypothetical protein
LIIDDQVTANQEKIEIANLYNQSTTCAKAKATFGLLNQPLVSRE